jgi:hypothetical protein
MPQISFVIGVATVDRLGELCQRCRVLGALCDVYRPKLTDGADQGGDDRCRGADPPR